MPKFWRIGKRYEAVSFPLTQYPYQNVDTARDLLLPENSTPEGQRLPTFSGATMVYALCERSLFWNAVTPRPIESELREWPIHRRELNVYYGMAERAMNVTMNYAQGSRMQKGENIVLKPLLIQ